MSTISKKFLEDFIDIFKSQPSLWQSRSDVYKNRNEKQKSWNILLEKYKEIEEVATIETVKKKVNGLKTAYRRELSKVIKSEEQVLMIYTPSLWYFDLFDFLRDQEVQAASIFTLNGWEETEIEKPAKRKKANAVEEDFLKTAAGYLDRESINTEKDDAQIFSGGWAAMYRKMDANQQLFAKRITDDALIQGQMGFLTFSSTVTPGVQQNQQYPSFRHAYLQSPSPNATQFSFPTGSSSTTVDIPLMSPYSSSNPSPATVEHRPPHNVQILSNKVVSQPISFQQLFNDQDYQ